MPKRRKISRGRASARPIKPLFVLVCEGKKTEPEYFQQFGGPDKAVAIKCINASASSPDKLLTKMLNILSQKVLNPSAEAWIVVDRNSWTPDALQRIRQWEESGPQYGFALSNPNFEYWLLLHFEVGNKIGSAEECVRRL